MNRILMKRCVVPGRAHSVVDINDPQRRPVAIALLGPDGWKVATADGVAAGQLAERQAISLMLSEAWAAVAR